MPGRADAGIPRAERDAYARAVNLWRSIARADGYGFRNAHGYRHADADTIRNAVTDSHGYGFTYADFHPHTPGGSTMNVESFVWVSLRTTDATLVYHERECHRVTDRFLPTPKEWALRAGLQLCWFCERRAAG